MTTSPPREPTLPTDHEHSFDHGVCWCGYDRNTNERIGRFEVRSLRKDGSPGYVRAAPSPAAPQDGTELVHSRYVSEMTAQILALKERVAELECRLEINPAAPQYDGIACRDETIRLQDDRIASQAARIAELERERDEARKSAREALIAGTHAAMLAESAETALQRAAYGATGNTIKADTSEAVADCIVAEVCAATMEGEREIARLEAALAAAQKDAERYRWLREWLPRKVLHLLVRKPDFGPDGTRDAGLVLDAAIDAARGRE